MNLAPLTIRLALHDLGAGHRFDQVASLQETTNALSRNFAADAFVTAESYVEERGTSLIAATRTFTHKQNCSALPQPWHENLDFDRIEDVLTQEAIVDIIPMAEFLQSQGMTSDFSHEVYLVEFPHGLRGVFKPENDLWASLGEVGIYRYARHLNLNFVPPTIIRKIGHKRGSMQLYVDTHLDVGKMGWEQILMHFSPLTRADVVTFTYSAGQWDYGGTNILIDPASAPVVIDNGLALIPVKARYGEHFFRRIAGRSLSGAASADFPFDAAIKLVNPSFQELQRIFYRWASENTIKRWYHNLQAFKSKTMSYVLWDGRVWVQFQRNTPPLFTDYYSSDTLDALERLDRQALREILPFDVFGHEHIAGILERNQQLLNHARTT